MLPIGGSVPKGLESPMKERKVIRIIDIARKENSMTKFEDVLETILEEYARRDSEGEFDTWEETDAFVKEKAEVLLAYVKEEPVSKQNLSNVQRTIKDWKEPVSEDLISVAKQYIDSHVFGNEEDKFTRSVLVDMFCSGAKWKVENLWKPADGDDLPEIDREVIALVDYDFGHYKVVYAHRPNPNGWNGTNIDTGEEEHFEPVIYDKGGWNQPHVLYWLDARLPYEEKN